MKATVDILGESFDVEYDFIIWAHGRPETGPTWDGGGEPAEAAEFEIKVFGISKANSPYDIMLPGWLESLIAEHLENRDDINEIVQRADMEGDYEP